MTLLLLHCCYFLYSCIIRALLRVFMFFDGMLRMFHLLQAAIKTLQTWKMLDSSLNLKFIIARKSVCGWGGNPPRGEPLFLVAGWEKSSYLWLINTPPHPHVCSDWDLWPWQLWLLPFERVLWCVCVCRVWGLGAGGYLHYSFPDTQAIDISRLADVKLETVFIWTLCVNIGWFDFCCWLNTMTAIHHCFADGFSVSHVSDFEWYLRTVLSQCECK